MSFKAGLSTYLLTLYPYTIWTVTMALLAGVIFSNQPGFSLSPVISGILIKILPLLKTPFFIPTYSTSLNF